MTFSNLLKQAVKKGLRGCGFEISRVSGEVSAENADPVLAYDRQGRFPWSDVYDAARRETVRRTLASQPMMEAFRRGAALPDEHGIGIDERCVEYAWAVSRIREDASRLMDAGSATNHVDVLKALLRPERNIHIVTLAPETFRMVDARVSYFYCDLRNLFFVRDACYDVIMCISTLEHIGMDNTVFTGGAGAIEQGRGAGADPALREMWRTLKPGGSLLITVPFGRYHDFGTFRQYDAKMVSEIPRAVSGCTTAVTYFRYRASGWQLASVESCADAEYVPWCMLPRQTRSPEPPRESDRAAAARAVACIELKKNRE